MLTNSDKDQPTKRQRQDSPSSHSSAEADEDKSLQEHTDTAREMMTARSNSFASVYSSNSSYNSSPGSSVSPTYAGQKSKISKMKRDSSNAQETTRPASQIPPEQVGAYDVLCGRDKSVFNHVGNRRFRVSLALWIPRYEEAQTKSQKASVIAALCNMLQNEAGVRFLKRHEEGQGDNKTVYYMELSATQTKKKVGHAIRDMSVARKEVTQRRASLKKARRESKKKSGSDSDGDDDASTTSHAEEKLSQSLTAMLPFVSEDLDDSGETSLEPLPILEPREPAEEVMTSQQPPSLPDAPAVASMPMPPAAVHPPAFQPSLLSARPPMMHQTQPPLPYYYTQHYHYYYHHASLDPRRTAAMGQQQQAVQRLSLTGTLNSGAGEAFSLYNNRNTEHSSDQQEADQSQEQVKK